MTDSLRDIAKMIDHSLLHPTMTDRDLDAGCRLARQHDVASVCIKPYAVTLARDILAGSDVLVCTVIGFPHGSPRPEVKGYEAEVALTDGATELDMVINVGKALSGDWDYVAGEIEAINTIATRRNAIVKVIFENDFLTRDADKARLCHICSEIGVAFVKTSTGYGFVRGADGHYNYAGATDHDLELMRRQCAPEVQVKAAGGVRTLDDLLRVRALGVTRVGATATEAILNAARARGYQ